MSCLWQVEELVSHLPDHRGWGKHTYYQSADGIFPAGSGSSLYWQTPTTQQGVPGGQQSIPCFLPSLLSLFPTCTSLTGISCSDCPCSLMPASMSSLSPLPFFHCLPPFGHLSTHTFQNKSYRTVAGQQSEHSCLPAMGAVRTQHPPDLSKQEISALLPLLMD